MRPRLSACRLNRYTDKHRIGHVCCERLLSRTSGARPPIIRSSHRHVYCIVCDRFCIVTAVIYFMDSVRRFFLSQLCNNIHTGNTLVRSHMYDSDIRKKQYLHTLPVDTASLVHLAFSGRSPRMRSLRSRLPTL
jgi:hypothetical protein